MTGATEVERRSYTAVDFEETELRLGLPGGGNGSDGDLSCNCKSVVSNGKRGFSETESVDLKLNLSNEQLGKDGVDNEKMTAKPPAKAQVVGWPPIRSYRKNVMTVQKNGGDDHCEKAARPGPATTAGGSSGAAFVKVSMDGAPYLRKVDLKLYKSYQELSDALGKMFSSFTIGNCESQGILKDFMNESKLVDILNGSEYVPTYEDKDGDWMLVGDVPWEMFVNSCKRLRIMKGSEAIGLAPRAVEKCKNRT